MKKDDLNNKEQKQDPRETILINYLSNFLPADSKDKTVIYKSSQDIADELVDMIDDWSINDISQIMIKTRYQLGLDIDGHLKWMMTQK